MENSQYKSRRKILFNKLIDNSVAILHSGYATFKSADAEFPFVVNNNFYYLTGIDQKDVTLIIGKFDNTYKEWLFLDPIDEVMAKWVGKTLSKEEASSLSGVDVKEISYNNTFNSFINGLFQPLRHFNNVAKTVYLDLERRLQELYNSYALEFAKKLQSLFPSVKIENAYPLVLEQRMVKSEDEVDLMVESIETTKRAIYNVMAHSKEHNEESIAKAYHDFVLLSEKKQNSFDAIVASGKNATVLHYVANNSKIEDNSLLLMDVGCYTNHYSSDISRTFPVSGKFTERQKVVYEVVLECNKKCIEYAKAGLSWKDLNDYAKKILSEGCKKLGLIKEDSELVKYYYHSIGHSLGLDVHDPAINSLGLLEGMVITIEPGLYIEEEGIGIRIEDDILITKDKAIVLSKNIIKEINDIEEFMK